MRNAALAVLALVLAACGTAPKEPAKGPAPKKPAYYSDDGPPERMIPVGFHARIQATSRVGGWISE